MLDTILLIIIFILGIYFGSFFTLATYRLPKHDDIVRKHSYCPNCNHKLGILDLIPVFSYIFLRGKCRYCSKSIGIRYFIFEVLTGITFVLFSISLKINIYEINPTIIVYFILAILYFSSLFILAGIEKEKGTIQKSVLLFGVTVSIAYMIYSYTLLNVNVYEYVIYLCFMISLLILDINFLKKKLNYNYCLQILILILYMLIFSGTYKTIFTVILTILAIGIRNIILYFKKGKTIVEKSKKNESGFVLCVSNIIVIIATNFIMNYMIL